MHWLFLIVIPSSLATDNPNGLGRKVERVANTPRRSLPPKRGGRTVGFQPFSMVS